MFRQGRTLALGASTAKLGLVEGVPTPAMRDAIRAVLALCGRERVFECLDPPQVAIRWQPAIVPTDEEWIVHGAATHDEAAVECALEFARRLKE